jgi:voltage-gated potassium channel Kch
MTIEGVDPPRVWYLEVLIFVMPILGIVLAAEGLVGATVLFLNKSRRQGEWNAVIASTYSQHTVVCGLGQLGEVLCLGLSGAGRQVVAVDIHEDQPAVVRTRREGVPVIVGDMTQPSTLTEANLAKACCIILCSRDDLANIEAAIVAKEMAPNVSVYARVFRKSLADRINSALRYDVVTFSPHATAAESILTQIGAARLD